MTDGVEEVLFAMQNKSDSSYYFTLQQPNVANGFIDMSPPSLATLTPRLGLEFRPVVLDANLDGYVDFLLAVDSDGSHNLALLMGPTWEDEASERLPVGFDSNTLTVCDVTGDGAPDIILSPL